MEMKSRKAWYCTNPQCQREIWLETGAESEGGNPRCSCGGILRKNDLPSFSAYLGFLRTEEPASVPLDSRKD
jgi:hypothetical protein